MSSYRGDLFQNLHKAYLKAFPYSTKANNQKQVVIFWNNAKKDFTDEKKFDNFILEKIKSLTASTPKARGKTVLDFFKKPLQLPTTSTISASTSTLSNSTASTSTLSSSTASTSASSNVSSVQPSASSEPSITPDQSSPSINLLKRKYSTPSQNETQLKIDAYNCKITSLTKIRDSNIGADDIDKDIKKARLELKKTERQLKTKVQNAEGQKRFREREKLKKLRADVSQNSQKQVGRPRKESEYPELLKAICDIAIYNSAAHERRQTEEIKTCTTLDALTKKLQDLGFPISRTATYLRLLPRKSNSIEGVRHVNTVPVRLAKPENDLHKSHIDGKFCYVTIRNVDTLAATLGPKQVSYISQDDKAKVQIGVTAAHKQAPKLMHLEYRVKLPDHDWAVASKHSLIPSVYGGMCIKDDIINVAPENVTFSGPTYIAIRSGKHSSSTASTHFNDVNRLYELDGFKEILYHDNQPKPVLIISVDGGPDENPRYHKTIAYAMEHFKKYELDAVFVMTNAPGRSAFNKVERRMAPLSRALTGVILPHNFHGDHLNSQKETIDKQLEKDNFAKAGEVLSQIWSEKVIDKFPVIATYVSNDETLSPVPEVDWSWHKSHVRESQYFLQIVKCNDRNCCKDFRSDLNLTLKDRFFPPPLLTKRMKNGRFQYLEDLLAQDVSGYSFLPLPQRLNLELPIKNFQFLNLPYDFHCPSIQEVLIDRVCPFCDLHFASMQNVKNHRKQLHPLRVTRATKKTKPVKIVGKRNREVLCIVENKNSLDAEWCDVEDVISNEEIPIVRENEFEYDHPVINSIDDWLQCDLSDI